ncbi:MAG: rhomboid family intramembrane serine protease [Chthonomonadales bacterium]
MIPLKDNIPVRRFPVITAGLIVLNILVYAVDRLTGTLHPSLVEVGPGMFQQTANFVGGISANWSMVPAAVAHGEPNAYWTLFTTMFLHANWLHIGGNMLFLWIFGSNVEDTLGRPKFMAFYLACGLLGSLCHVASDPASMVPTVGASGAIAGLMGAYLILFPKAEIMTIVPIIIFGAVMDVPAVVVILFSAVVEFVNAKLLGGSMMHNGGVAYFAHLGGFLSGMLLIILMGGRKLAESKLRYVG